MSRIDYSKDKEYMKFSELLNNFFTMESIEWNNINNLKSDEFLGIIRFYENFVSKLDSNYPRSREESERYLQKEKYRYGYRVQKKYKFHHYLLPFHKILEDRLVFFKSVKKAIESWNKKKFSIALKDYKLIYDIYLDMNEILDKNDLSSGWYKYRRTIKRVNGVRSWGGKNWGVIQISKSMTPTRTEPMHARGFSNDDKKNYNFKKLINIVKNRLEDLNHFFQYREIIELFNDGFNIKSYNRAFDNYLKAEYYKNKIGHSNLGYFGILEKEEKFKEKFAVVLLILSNKIRKVVLDLGAKFSKLEIQEIKEKCDVESTDLILEVIKKMIKNHEIYAEYFSSSNSIAFDQQANSKEIDNLLKKYEQWEKEEKDKIV